MDWFVNLVRFLGENPLLVGFALTIAVVYASIAEYLAWRPSIVAWKTEIARLTEELAAVRERCAEERKEQTDMIYRLLEAGKGASHALRDK